METSLQAQLLALGLALALGVGLGLLYDLLRPPRRHGGGLFGAILDLLFALGAGAAAFLHAMAAPSGRLGLWELCAALLGFLFYLHALSPVLLPVLELPYRVMGNIMRSCKKDGKFLADSVKKYFQNAKDWIIMRQ